MGRSPSAPQFGLARTGKRLAPYHRGMRFAKGHGTENDFVVLPDFEDDLVLTPALVTRLCDRRAGLGGGGLLRGVLAAPAAPAAVGQGDAGPAAPPGCGREPPSSG